MNTTIMRRIDRAAGSPMCALLTLLRRLTDPFRPRAPEQPSRILIVKLAEQGAWVVAWSAIQDAIELVGRDNVLLMTFADNRPVLDQLDVVPAGNIIAVRTDGPVRTSIDLWRAVRRARAERVDAAVDFEFFARSSAILCFLSGARRRVGFHRSNRESAYRGNLHTHRLSFNQRLHVGESFRLLVGSLTDDASRLPAVTPRKLDPQPPPMCESTEEAKHRAREMLTKALGGGQEPSVILLNANAGDLLPLRRWPERHYRELALRLLEQYPEVTIVFTGSRAEAREASRLARSVGSNRAVSLAGRTSLGELIALYSISEVLVTNDSGPAHYAALTPIDVVTLYGPESPHVFGSLSPRNHPLWAGLPCSPCVNAYNDRVSSCTDNQCMKELGVERVLRIVTEVYEARHRDLGDLVGTVT